MSETEAGSLFAESVAIMSRLRGPGGCPWDREQTFDSIRKYTLEETWEVLDAIDRRQWTDLAEELGDLLLQVLFYAQMADDEGRFSITDVLHHLNRKLIRRHPHVFGEQASAAAGNRAAVNASDVAGPAEVLRNWDAIKQAEKSQNGNHAPASLLDSVPRSFPALLEATKLGSRAAKVGFDWPDLRGLIAKVDEECREIEAEIATSSQSAIEEEIGDLLFTVVNLARHAHADPEVGLRGANAKFRRRFRAMEQASPRPLEACTPAELETLWDQAKRAEMPVETLKR
jgi:ATP diphosphatase